jgi:hypothetical protein
LLTDAVKRSNLKKLKMIKIKDKVNKTEVFKELTEIGKKRFEFTCEPDEDLKVFLDGAEQLFKLLRLTDVIVPKGTLCDCKEHSIKTNYGFEVCTKCGNEFND